MVMERVIWVVQVRVVQGHRVGTWGRKGRVVWVRALWVLRKVGWFELGHFGLGQCRVGPHRALEGGNLLQSHGTWGRKPPYSALCRALEGGNLPQPPGHLRDETSPQCPGEGTWGRKSPSSPRALEGWNLPTVPWVGHLREEISLNPPLYFCQWPIR